VQRLGHLVPRQPDERGHACRFHYLHCGHSGHLPVPVRCSRTRPQGNDRNIDHHQPLNRSVCESGGYRACALAVAACAKRQPSGRYGTFGLYPNNHWVSSEKPALISGLLAAWKSPERAHCLSEDTTSGRLPAAPLGIASTTDMWIGGELPPAALIAART